MNGMNTIQFEDIARQRLQQSAEAARTYAQRRPHPADVTETSRRHRHWHLRWPHPAHAGVVGP